MEARIKALTRERTRVFCLCIGYFLLILAAGSLVFWKDASYAQILVVACVAIYLVLVRPMLSRYKGRLRRELLEIHLGKHLKNMTYDPKGGCSREDLEKTQLVPLPLDSFLSRELVKGRSGGFSVTMADVTFPIRVGSQNQMLSGCAIRVEAGQNQFRPLRVEAGEVLGGFPTEKEEVLLETIGSLIPGSLYVNAQETRLDVILRGRFLGWRINPLMEVTAGTLAYDPMPELKPVLDLARSLCK